MNNVVERYNNELNNMFDLPNQDWFVIYERLNENVFLWEKRYKDVLNCNFTNRQGRNKVAQSEVPQDNQ